MIGLWFALYNISICTLVVMAADYVPYWTEQRVWGRLQLAITKAIADDALIVPRPGAVVLDTLMLFQFCRYDLQDNEEAKQIFSSLKGKLEDRKIERTSRGNVSVTNHSFPRMRNGRPFYIDAE